MHPPVLLRAADRCPQPWKNGGGVTREIAVFPSGAGMADFDWRISMADVTEAGSFSCFAGVDRVLAVLEGELELVFQDQPAPIRLTPRSAPHPFAGDVAVSGAPLGGAVRDCNVMVRRGRFAAKVTRIDLAAGSLHALEVPDCCVLVALGEVTVRIGGADHELARDDAIKFDSAAIAEVAAANDHAALLIIALAAL